VKTTLAATQPRVLPTFDGLFDNYRGYAWRLEARDVFNVGVGEDSDITAWLAGQYRQDLYTDWRQFTRTGREQGKPVSRVRLVGHPITLYTAWEVSTYIDNIAAGEEVRVLDRNKIVDDLNPLWDMDFWLFDDRYVAIMHYDRTGGFHGATVTDDVDRFVEHRTLALRLSVPHDEYQLPPW
jgi:hypothetical protein